jgi:hypothetical protein
VPDAFYERDGDRFISTELTRGPWDPDSQHAGPPAALIGRALEAHPGIEDGHVGRVTYEILRPVPIAPLRVAVDTIRPGRKVELLTASLLDEAGEELVRANAWRIRSERVDLPEGIPSPAPPSSLADGRHKEFFPTGQDTGYHTAMEYRFTSGAFLEPGPATVWMRMGHPLVQGEDPSPLVRVLTAADTGNGISVVLDFRRYLFINVDLTVHLHRMPAGEWICLDAVTLPEPTGAGISDTALYDERGSIGLATQTLLVAEREPSG